MAAYQPSGSASASSSLQVLYSSRGPVSGKGVSGPCPSVNEYAGKGNKCVVKLSARLRDQPYQLVDPFYCDYF